MSNHIPDFPQMPKESIRRRVRTVTAAISSTAYLNIKVDIDRTAASNRPYLDHEGRMIVTRNAEARFRTTILSKVHKRTLQ